MTGLEYLKKVKDLRRKIQQASLHDFASIEKELAQMSEIKPMRLSYFLAQAEFMVKKDLPKQDILRFLKEKEHFYSPHRELSDFFKICEALLPDEDLIGKENCRFQRAVYDRQPTVCFERALEAARAQYLESPDSVKFLGTLAGNYYITQNLYLYLLTSLLCCKLNNKLLVYDQFIKTEVLDLPNVGYLLELLTDGKSHPFIVAAETQEDAEDCKVLSEVLLALGQYVYVIEVPVICQVQNEMTLKDTLAVTLNHAEESDHKMIFYPIRLMKQEKIIGDNRNEIISHITENLVEDHLSTVLCTGKLLDEMPLQRNGQYPFQRLSVMMPDLFRKSMAFAWTGDYLSYISRIYQFDTRAKLEEVPECEFSIVIPARNSADTLRYTLQTCLEQRFQGRYEVLLSDNSSDGNTEVYDLYCDIHDTRVRYVKAPRELPLAKSFEFAFLQAKGAFVFSIGSDDGVLPWTLEILDSVLKENSDENVILWKRGFYAWPGFNKGQQHQFVIPSGKFEKGMYSTERISTSQILEETVKKSNLMYFLPSFYINSGYRKKYLHKILEKTGRLWDGASQDIHMGVVNCVINDEIMYLDYPLTMAGMSNASIGYSGVRVNRTIEKNPAQMMKKVSNCTSMGGLAHARLCFMVPLLSLDPYPFYNGLLQLISTGHLSAHVLEKFKWEEIYVEMARKLSVEDVLLEQKLGSFRHSAQMVSAEMLAFVKEHICKPLLTPRKILPHVSGEEVTRCYQVESAKDGEGMVLDASEFGVRDIYGAVKLFEELTKL